MVEASKKEIQIFKSVVDTETYTIEVNGVKKDMKGSELKTYMVAMRGQIDFSMILEKKTQKVEPKAEPKVKE